MIDSKTNSNKKRIPVASYTRMSTEHQKYSTTNQIEAIKSYAEDNDMEIVAMFSDKGKSGLTVKGRAGLSSLLTVVMLSLRLFSFMILVDGDVFKIQTKVPITNISASCKV